MPRVYETSPAEFQQQVEFRITILRAWALAKVPVCVQADGTSMRDAQGEEVYEYLPFKALQDFCDWTAMCNGTAISNIEYSFEGKSATLNLLKRIGRSTLNQPVYSDLRESARTAMRLAKARRDLQDKSDNKNSRIKELTERVKFLQDLVNVQEVENRELRNRLSDEVEERTKDRRKSDNNLARLTAQKIKLEERVSELTRTLAKVTSIGTAAAPTE